MSEPSPPPYINPPTESRERLTEWELLRLRECAAVFRSDTELFITGRQLRALLADHDELHTLKQRP